MTPRKILKILVFVLFFPVISAHLVLVFAAMTLDKWFETAELGECEYG
jgi:general stress protein CsbA